MRKAKLVSVLAMVVTAIFVQPVTAGLISQSAHHDFYIEPGASSFQEYMGGFFTPFDDQGGTLILERVTLTYSIIASAHITVENDTEHFMDTVLVTATIHLGVTPWPSPVDMPFEYMTDLQASDGIAGAGPDFYDFGILSLDGFGHWDTTSDMAWFSSDNPEDEFVFNGSVEFAIGGETWTPFLNVSDLNASMNASLTYEYVPEPASATLLAIGLSGLMWRRRRR